MSVSYWLFLPYRRVISICFRKRIVIWIHIDTRYGKIVHFSVDESSISNNIDIIAGTCQPKGFILRWTLNDWSCGVMVRAVTFYSLHFDGPSSNLASNHYFIWNSEKFYILEFWVSKNMNTHKVFMFLFTKPFSWRTIQCFWWSRRSWCITSFYLNLIKLCF